MSRLVAAFVLGIFVATLAGVAPAGAHHAPDDPQTEPSDDLPEGSRTIIGSPGPGPEPEHSGDRGGWTQLLLLGVLAAAVGFIGWRITLAVRPAPAEISPPGPRRSP